MRAVVIYESMYGNTHLVAQAIADGLAPGNEVTVVPVSGAAPELLEGADLVVVGGPTHAHSASRPATRQAAAQAAGKPESELTLEPGAIGPGLREWFAGLGQCGSRAAAFDTRVKAPAALTGRASKLISRALHSHGLDVIAQPESFFVTKDNHLHPSEEDRARRWGGQLAAAIKATAGTR